MTTATNIWKCQEKKMKKKKKSHNFHGISASLARMNFPNKMKYLVLKTPKWELANYSGKVQQEE